MISADISIVTCSMDDRRFHSFKRNLTQIFGDDVQIVRVADATSMAEGYNRGARMATGDIIIFCHDDIEFLNQEAPQIIREDLVDFDIVGVAGTTRLAEGRWHTAGKKYVHGQVAHSCDAHGNEYQVCLYGQGCTGPVVSNIQALDGLFFAVRNSILTHVRFDETFSGFHLYDLDFTFAAYLRGYRIAVDYRIHLLHLSGGRYDPIWKKFNDMFNKKYEHLLSKPKDGALPEIHRYFSSSKGNLSSEMQRYFSGDTCNP
jgi:glycosyltransferase involved in cell wall biosynthesis